MVAARALSVLLLTVALLAARAAPAVEIAPEEAREPLPDIEFLDMQDKPARLSDFRGRVVVLNLWATWCAPCREEMPSLDRLQQAFADEPVTVLALSVDRAGPERVRQFLEEIGVRHLAVYRDPKMRATRALRVPGLPATILVDRQGREVGRHLGIAEWDSDGVQAAIRGLLAEPAP
jgi:thiol-disulfide isomerase/thioredoxin